MAFVAAITVLPTGSHVGGHGAPMPCGYEADKRQAPRAWTAVEDALAVAAYFGKLSWREAARQCGLHSEQIRGRALHLALKAGRPSKAQREAAAKAVFG